MTTETKTEQTPRQRIQAAIDELGLTMKAEFIPFSKSRNAKPKDGKVWRSLNWNVTLIKAARVILTTDYSAGEAHCPSYKQGARRTVDYQAALDYEIEHGKAALASSGWSTMARPGAKIILPDLVDVVTSLVMDASVLDCSSFDEWALDLGYDTDSRKAEATYRACLESALKLRNGIGEAGLAKLRDACQDY